MSCQPLSTPASLPVHGWRVLAAIPEVRGERRRGEAFVHHLGERKAGRREDPEVRGRGDKARRRRRNKFVRHQGGGGGGREASCGNGDESWVWSGHAWSGGRLGCAAGRGSRKRMQPPFPSPSTHYTSPLFTPPPEPSPLRDMVHPSTDHGRQRRRPCSPRTHLARMWGPVFSRGPKT